MRVQCKFLFGESTAHITTDEVDKSQVFNQSSASTPTTELRTNACQAITFIRLSTIGANPVLVIPTVIYCLHV